MVNLAQWRAHCGLTQAKAANAVGITERHYRRIETGKAPINRRMQMLLEAMGAYDHHIIE